MKKIILNIVLLLCCSQSMAEFNVNNYEFKRILHKGNLPTVQFSNLSHFEQKATSQIINSMNAYIVNCNNTTYFRIFDSKLIEVSKPKLTMFFQSRKLDYADTLNDISWKGLLHVRVDGQAFRIFSNSNWDKWEPIITPSYNSYNLPAMIENGELKYDKSASDFIYGNATRVNPDNLITCEIINKILGK